MSNQQVTWPLRLDPEEAALAGLAALYVSMPYGGLSTEQARGALKDPALLGPLGESIPDAARLLEQGLEWTLLAKLNSAVEGWPLERRNTVGIELVLGGDYVPVTEDFDDALYWRRVDTALEALETEFAAHEVIDAALAEATWLSEESKSGVRTLLTSSDLIDVAEAAHEMQAYVTGIYVPFAADALRWGQRKLDTVSDEDLILSVAADIIRLKQRAGVGDLDAVREYGVLLTDDIRDMSMRNAHGASPDRKAAQIRIFTTLLRVVSELLGEDDDGLAPELTPGFEGMRLNEVYQLAEAFAVTLKEEDGHFDGEEGSARTVWNAANWYVKSQRPAPGQPLGRRRQVRLWVLKHHEHGLSAYQRNAVAQLDAPPVTSP